MQPWLFTLGAVLLLNQSANGTQSDNPRRSPIDRVVDSAASTFFQDAGHVGLSFAILDHGQVSFYNYGSVSRDKAQLPTRDTIYEIGSITKTFTGALASRAVVDGKMRLDGDFREYLPVAYPNLVFGDKHLSLRTLSAHTSGLPRDLPDTSDLFKNPDFENLPQKLIERERGYDKARCLEELGGVRLASEPGLNFNYSNLGAKLVGFGLENVYKTSFENLLDHNISRPLGLTRTTLEVTPADRPLLAQGYGVTGKPVPYHPLYSGAAGGIYSNTRDMIGYAAWHLDETDPVVKKAHALIAGKMDNFGRAMYWNMATTADGERKIWQSGGVFGMSSQMILFPDAKVAFVLLANDGGFNTQSQLEAIALKVRKAQLAK